MIQTESYGEFKEQVLDQEPAFYTTEMKNVRLESTKVLSIEGKRFPLTSAGLDSIRSLVKIPKAFSRRVESYLGSDAQVGLMDALRNGMARAENDMQVMTAIDKSEGRVIALRKAAPRISFGGYFDLLERVMDRYNLDLGTYSYDEENGLIQVGTQANNKQYELKDFEDEVFKAGPFFVNELGELQLHSYMNRLICGNGMRDWRREQNFRASLNREDMSSFFEYIDEMAANHFVPEDFVARVHRASRTPASVREMEQVRNIMKKYDVEEGTNDFLEHFIPMREVRKKYYDVGEDVTMMTKTQKKNAPSNMKVWELVNSLTNFASHDQAARNFSFDSSDANHMISEAGKLLNRKTFDAENLVRVPDFRSN